MRRGLRFWEGAWFLGLTGRAALGVLETVRMVLGSLTSFSVLERRKGMGDVVGYFCS